MDEPYGPWQFGACHPHGGTVGHAVAERAAPPPFHLRGVVRRSACGAGNTTGLRIFTDAFDPLASTWHSRRVCKDCAVAVIAEWAAGLTDVSAVPT